MKPVTCWTSSVTLVAVTTPRQQQPIVLYAIVALVAVTLLAAIVTSIW